MARTTPPPANLNIPRTPPLKKKFLIYLIVLLISYYQEELVVETRACASYQFIYKLLENLE